MLPGDQELVELTELHSINNPKAELLFKAEMGASLVRLD